MSADMRPLSAGQSVIETQTDESFLRECKSAADMGAYAKMERRAVQQTLRRKIGSDDIREMLSDEEFTSDLVRKINFQFCNFNPIFKDQADGIILNPGPVRSSTQNQIAIPFKVNTRSYKVFYFISLILKIFFKFFFKFFFKTFFQFFSNFFKFFFKIWKLKF